MSLLPFITFKAGICDLDTSTTPHKVKPKPEPGYIYLYEEDEITHFCWRRRSAPADDPEIDLFMVPGDGSFVPYRPSDGKSPTNGRIFVMKFSSSSQRHLFYLQSLSQDENKDPAFWSARDLKLGQIINAVLQGQEVNMTEELLNLRQSGNNGDDDETMEDVEAHNGDHDAQNQEQGGAAGAGAGTADGGARGGTEGSGGRGSNGDRDTTSRPTDDPNAIVQNLLRSLANEPAAHATAIGQPAEEHDDREDTTYATLGDLLTPESTLPVIDAADATTVDNLLSYLPMRLQTMFAQESSKEGNAVDAASLSIEQKKTILRKVLRSPQFTQSVGSLTGAIEGGGLPSISDALNISVQNGGFAHRSGIPMSGGPAVRAFVEGVKRHVQNEGSAAGAAGDRMDTD